MTIHTDAWPRQPNLLSTPEGTVDLRTGEIKASNASDLIRQRTEVSPDGNCPEWEALIAFVCDDDSERVRFLQQWLGYCLTGHTCEQKFLFVHGDGGTGKGTVFNSFAKVLGGYAGTLPSTSLMKTRNDDRHPGDLASVNAARLVMASETERGRQWAEERVKSITGEDPISARYYNGNFFTFIPQFKLTILGNTAPRMTDLSGAIQRRLIVFPMTRKPKTQDTGLPDRLALEASGILNWAVEGAVDWSENGLLIPDAIRSASERYFEEQDAFAAWLRDCCLCGSNLRATPTELFRSWQSYARDSGVEPGTLQGTFSEDMKAKGFRSSKSNGARVYRGIAPARLAGEDDDYASLV